MTIFFLLVSCIIVLMLIISFVDTKNNNIVGILILLFMTLSAGTIMASYQYESGVMDHYRGRVVVDSLSNGKTTITELPK